MRPWRRPIIVLAAGLVLALAVGAAAVVDHRHKKRVMNRLQVAEWFCENRGNCGGESSAAVERRWTKREIGYEVTVAVLVVASLGGATLLRRRQGSRSARGPRAP